MPLDMNIYRVTPEIMETGFAGVRQLSTELKASLPWNFVWDFSLSYGRIDECSSRGCAIGLANLLWPEQVTLTGDASHLLHHLAIEDHNQRHELYEIFGYSSSGRYPQRSDGGTAWSRVTPQMVADELDEFCNKYDV